MSSREDILQNIRRNTRVRYEKPDLSALEQGAITYADQVAQFCKVVAEVGGRVVTVNEGEDVNALVRKLYPDAKRIASNLKNITCATFHPDDVEASADLDGTDLAVVDGRIGVCENGANLALPNHTACRLFMPPALQVGKSSVSCPLKPSDSAPLKHSTMPP